MLYCNLLHDKAVYCDLIGHWAMQHQPYGTVGKLAMHYQPVLHGGEGEGANNLVTTCTVSDMKVI